MPNTSPHVQSPLFSPAQRTISPATITAVVIDTTKNGRRRLRATGFVWGSLPLGMPVMMPRLLPANAANRPASPTSGRAELSALVLHKHIGNVGHAGGVEDAPAIARLLAATTVTALCGVATWWAWLSWDHASAIRSDGVKTVSPGPFSTWQTVGCCASIAIATVLSYLWVRRGDIADGMPGKVVVVGLLSCAAPLGFAIPWGRAGNENDETGLYLGGVVIATLLGIVGLVILLIVVESIAATKRRA